MKKIIDKKVRITSEGCLNGTWQVKITGIKDEHLHKVEVAVLAIFGRKKKPLSFKYGGIGRTR